MQFDIITIFPRIFDSYFQEGILKRAAGLKKKIKIRVHDLRKYTHDQHKTVDDRPYGGGPGMVLMAEPLIRSIVAVRKYPPVLPIKKLVETNDISLSSKVERGKKKRSHVVLFSAKGTPFSQDMARRFTTYDQLIMVCGRYEGVDERVLNFVDHEISIGEYVLTGGEIPAMIVVDSVSRLIPGVLGCAESTKDESHTTQGVVEYPHFTRPEIVKLTPKQQGYIVRPRRKQIPDQVPNILLSGHHAHIDTWREEHKTVFSKMRR